MSRKALLNITSRKKRDTMLTWSNTVGSGATTGNNQVLAPGALVVRGDQYCFSLWCPTARDLTTGTGNVGSVAFEAQRTATTCFMRGLKENIKVSTNTGACWMWRRICFTARSGNLIGDSSGTNPFKPYVDTSNGIGRQFFNLSINNQSLYLTTLKGLLFRGVETVDWNDILTAPVDNIRVDLKYDKYMKISSGNANGQVRDYRFWNGMNKNLVYDDDENGDVMSQAYYSVDDKRGMGDFYVLDIIVPAPNTTSSDILYASSTASLYWHEK